MTTPQPSPRRRSPLAQLWLHESELREAVQLTDPDERAAAVAQVHTDFPKPAHPYRRSPR